MAREKGNLMHWGTTLSPPERDNWRGIRLVNAYRVLLSFALVAAAITGRGPHVLGQQDLYLYAFAAWGYLLMSVGFEFLLELHVMPFRPQAHLHALGDLLVLILIMHASGGPGGGVALLMIISVGLNAVLLGGSAAIGYAALASLAVLGEAVFSTWLGQSERQFAAAGFLGFALFVVTILVATFEQRAQRFERITRRREQEVNYLSTLAVQIIEQSSNGVLISEPNGQVDYINSAACQLLGAQCRNEPRSPAKVHVARSGAAMRLQDTHAALAAALEDWQGSHRDGHSVEMSQPQRFRAEFHALDTELGPRYLVVLIDLSAEDARVQQNKLASLGRLTASIAHEVRNPLSSIRQAAELLADTKTEEEREQLIPIIIRHSIRINTLVEGVLDVARRPNVQPAKIDLATWLGEFVNLHRLDWEANNVHWQVPTLSPGKHLIRFDLMHLGQIMDNLVMNAQRHGRDSDGAVQLRLEIREGTQDPEMIEICVCDTGPGLAKEVRNALFEPFMTTHNQGIGLGLYISRELALANGAQLYARAQSNETTGCCFCLQAPEWTENPD
ncbi:sensor histidine kinase [Halothiobacillus diazotrophicus]|nr:PAS domain-containing sensor histidine kinase [Halothiobacillus diazotrophicus]